MIWKNIIFVQRWNIRNHYNQKFSYTLPKLKKRKLNTFSIILFVPWTSHAFYSLFHEKNAKHPSIFKVFWYIHYWHSFLNFTKKFYFLPPRNHIFMLKFDITFRNKNVLYSCKVKFIFYKKSPSRWWSKKFKIYGKFLIWKAVHQFQRRNTKKPQDISPQIVDVLLFLFHSLFSHYIQKNIYTYNKNLMRVVQIKSLR